MDTKYFKLRLGNYDQFYEIRSIYDETVLIARVFPDGHIETVKANLQDFVTNFDRYKELIYLVDSAVDLLNA